MSVSNVTFRLGSDPEIFLVNPQGKHIAINGYINADKINPLQIEDMPIGFTLQEDNVALEYGIPPAATSKDFQEYIAAVMERSRSWLPPELTFSKESCTIFEDDQLNHPMSMVFGCEPDYCAYTEKTNPKPRPPHYGMRSAGGHIHVETKLDPVEVVKAMDIFLGVPSVLIDNGKERKKLYGKAGAYRYKPYGVEYRTLSNFWVFEPNLIDWVWTQTEKALAFVQDGKMTKELSRMARVCINKDDHELAHKIAVIVA